MAISVEDFVGVIEILFFLQFFYLFLKELKIVKSYNNLWSIHSNVLIFLSGRIDYQIVPDWTNLSNSIFKHGLIIITNKYWQWYHHDIMLTSLCIALTKDNVITCQINIMSRCYHISKKNTLSMSCQQWCQKN